MFLGLNEEFGVELFLHERIEELDQSRVDCLGSLGIPLLHQSTELILHTTEHNQQVKPDESLLYV